jgi:NRPS condensation-like uncharacterized protein
MGTAESAIERLELPKDVIAFLKAYAKEHGMTLSSLLVQYASDLRAEAQRKPHPANVQFTGKVPPHIDAREAYLHDMEEKHR